MNVAAYNQEDDDTSLDTDREDINGGRHPNKNTRRRPKGGGSKVSWVSETCSESETDVTETWLSDNYISDMRSSVGSSHLSEDDSFSSDDRSDRSDDFSGSGSFEDSQSNSESDTFDSPLGGADRSLDSEGLVTHASPDDSLSLGGKSLISSISNRSRVSRDHKAGIAEGHLNHRHRDGDSFSDDDDSRGSEGSVSSRGSSVISGESSVSESYSADASSGDDDRDSNRRTHERQQRFPPPPRTNSGSLNSQNSEQERAAIADAAVAAVTGINVAEDKRRHLFPPPPRSTSNSISGSSSVSEGEEPRPIEDSPSVGSEGSNDGTFNNSVQTQSVQSVQTSTSNTTVSSACESAAMQHLAGLVLELRGERDRLENQLNETEDRYALWKHMQEQQSHQVGGLEGQLASQVQAYVNSSKDNDEENEALRAEVESLREEKIAAHDLVARLKNEKSASSLASLKSSSSSLNDLNLETRGRDESILKNLETKVQDLTDENHKLESELRLMVDDKLETRQEMEALKAAAATAESSKDVAAATTRATLLRRRLDQVQAERATLVATNEDLTQSIEGLRSTSEDLLSTNEDLVRTVDELKLTVDGLTFSVEDLKSKNEELTLNNEDLIETNENLVEINEELTRTVAQHVHYEELSSESAMEDLRTTIAKLEEDAKSTKSDFAAQRTTLEERNAALTKVIKEMKSTLRESVFERRALREEVTMLAEEKKEWDSESSGPSYLPMALGGVGVGSGDAHESEMCNTSMCDSSLGTARSSRAIQVVPSENLGDSDQINDYDCSGVMSVMSSGSNVSGEHRHEGDGNDSVLNNDEALNSLKKENADLMLTVASLTQDKYEMSLRLKDAIEQWEDDQKLQASVGGSVASEASNRTPSVAASSSSSTSSVSSSASSSSSSLTGIPYGTAYETKKATEEISSGSMSVSSVRSSGSSNLDLHQDQSNVIAESKNGDNSNNNSHDNSGDLYLLRQQLAETEDEIDALLGRGKEAESRVEDLEDELEHFQKENTRLRDERDSACRENEELVLAIENLEGDLIRSSNSSSQSKLELELEEENDTTSIGSSGSSSSRNSRKKLARKASSSSTGSLGSTEGISSLSSRDVGGLDDSNSNRNESLSTLTATDKPTTSEREETLMDQIEEMEDEIEALLEERQEADDKMRAMRRTIDDVKDEKCEASMKLMAVIAEKKEAARKVRELEKALANAREAASRGVEELSLAVVEVVEKKKHRRPGNDDDNHGSCCGSLTLDDDAASTDTMSANKIMDTDPHSGAAVSNALVASLTEELKFLREEKRSIHERVTRSEEDRTEAYEAVREMKREKESLEAEVNRLEEALNEVEDCLAEEETASKSKMDDEVSRLEEELADAKKKLGEAEDEIAALKNATPELDRAKFDVATREMKREKEALEGEVQRLKKDVLRSAKGIGAESSASNNIKEREEAVREAVHALEEDNRQLAAELARTKEKAMAAKAAETKAKEALKVADRQETSISDRYALTSYKSDDKQRVSSRHRVSSQTPLRNSTSTYSASTRREYAFGSSNFSETKSRSAARPFARPLPTFSSRRATKAGTSSYMERAIVPVTAVAPTSSSHGNKLASSEDEQFHRELKSKNRELRAVISMLLSKADDPIVQRRLRDEWNLSSDSSVQDVDAVFGLGGGIVSADNNVALEAKNKDLMNTVLMLLAEKQNASEIVENMSVDLNIDPDGVLREIDERLERLGTTARFGTTTAKASTTTAVPPNNISYQRTGSNFTSSTLTLQRSSAKQQPSDCMTAWDELMEKVDPLIAGNTTTATSSSSTKPRMTATKLKMSSLVDEKTFGRRSSFGTGTGTLYGRKKSTDTALKSYSTTKSVSTADFALVPKAAGAAEDERSQLEVRDAKVQEALNATNLVVANNNEAPKKRQPRDLKSKLDLDQLTAIYFEKCGVSVSKMSDVTEEESVSIRRRVKESKAASAAAEKGDNNSVVHKKVKICRNGVFMGTYEGDLNDDGQRHGVGILTCDNGNSYEGDWNKDKRDGRGIARYSSGDVYDGEWTRGKRQGHGIMYIAAGDTYIGGWNNGLKHAAGTYHWADGDVDVSLYQSDKRVGEGVRWNADRSRAFRLIRGMKKEEISMDEAYRTAESLGLFLENKALGSTMNESESS